MQGQGNRPLRLTTSAMAALAVLAFLVATVTPFVPRTNWMWSWEDRATAMAAGFVGAASAVGAVAAAAVAWRGRMRRPPRLLGLQFALLVATVFGALLFHRSGTWLSDIRPLIIGS